MGKFKVIDNILDGHLILVIEIGVEMSWLGVFKQTRNGEEITDDVTVPPI
nr:hypothetical protein [Halalkalicoccus paucihalophilus]